MKLELYLIFLLLISIESYDRNKAVAYAKQYATGVNHDCNKSRWACSPYGYFGNDKCKYKRDKDGFGDCANFVSQCLIAGGMNFQKCKVRSCGVILGANSLGKCLKNDCKWKSECGKQLPPPSYIEKGDVIIFHEGRCNSNKNHAMIVTSGGKNALVSGHSPHVYNVAYTSYKKKNYYEWIHFTG